jgi:hypothetical protein
LLGLVLGPEDEAIYSSETIFELLGVTAQNTSLFNVILNTITLSQNHKLFITKKLRGFSPPANYTDQATALVDEVSANFCG